MDCFRLHHTLAHGLQRAPDATAFLLPTGEKITYAAFANRVAAARQRLQRAGIQRHDRVGIQIPRSADEIACVFAVAESGAVFSVASAKWRSDQVVAAARQCGWRALFCTPQGSSEMSARLASEKCQILTVTPNLLSEPCDVSYLPPPVEGSDLDLAGIFFTSGTSGTPKGVMISHRTLLDGLQRVDGYLQHRPTDRILPVLSPSAPWGTLQFAMAFARGAAVVLAPVAIPDELAKLVRRHEATGLPAMPPTWVGLVEYLLDTGTCLPSLRYVTSSGGVIPRRILAAMPSVFPNADIHLTYGLSEAFRSTVVPPEWFQRKMGSLGRPCPNVDIHLVHESGRLCQPGEIGELIHRGTLVAQGYWNDAEATAASFRPCAALRESIGDQIVHFSGDLVRQDEEGFLWYVERKLEQIKVSGYRVSAEQIETTALETGWIVAAVAVGMPDPRLGQRVELVVEPGTGSPGNVVPRLDAHLRATLPSYMWPGRIHRWNESLPRMETGKLDRAEVLRMLSTTSKVAPDHPPLAGDTR